MGIHMGSLSKKELLHCIGSLLCPSNGKGWDEPQILAWWGLFGWCTCNISQVYLNQVYSCGSKELVHQARLTRYLEATEKMDEWEAPNGGGRMTRSSENQFFNNDFVC